ncbi:MAG: polysaccharide deacetylase family protein [candidate division WOR-3 bacterium]
MMLICLLLTYLFSAAPESALGSEHRVILSIDDGYRCIYDNVYPLLKKYKMTATIALIVDYVAGIKTGYGNPNTFLSYNQIKEMIDSTGIEIASHSLSHPYLTRLDSAQAWHEIYRSRTFLESVFGVPVITFVYPYGDRNPRVIRMVRRAGYRLGRAVKTGEINLWVEPYQLPIFELRKETSLEAVKEHIKNNPVSILLLHRIVPQPAVFTEWSLENFAALIEWLAANQIKTLTLADLYYEWREDVVKRMIQERTKTLPVFEPESLLQKIHIDATRTLNPR